MGLDVWNVSAIHHRRSEMNRTKAITVGVVIIVVIGTTAWRGYSHCQIPCGIYDDKARLVAIGEHIRTIEKSMEKIDSISATGKPNHNQLIRWVNNKEFHANQISEIVTEYFMTQRIKPADPTDKRAHGQYVRMLTLLHRTLIAAMKAKQTTDLQYTKELATLLDEFTRAYGLKADKQ